MSPVATVDPPSFAADPPSVSASLKIVTQPAGTRTVVVVSGEVDIDTEQAVQRALRLALARSPGGLDLDLAGVGFCDCAGLNALLSVRRTALANGKTLGVRAASAGVERLFALTDTSSLFSHAPDPAATDAVVDTWREHSPTTHDLMEENGVSDEAEELRVEVVQLKRAMLTRPVIDLARGVLMASFGLNRDDAWSVLVDVSQRTNTKLHQLAEELVDSVNGAPLPEHLQQRISTAVAEISRPA
ncbi:ANTAR domain-containing protein [Streptomyces sp. NBC_00986]|uniref:ANTAR domain-containing protein n=1 Tax=Streptomyces sp. NBC_00986 TaxID=2903702 RepID=UPI00386DD1A7|nr:ANTAR domain-containing protein [Streptomyces sp. NBC_00986]